MTKFHGIFPALLTPFDANNKINEKALEKLIGRNLRAGVRGFYVCGSTAEVFLLKNDERRALMRTVKDIAGDRATLIAHVGAVSADEAAELAAEAAGLGYDAVSACAPFYYKFSLGEIRDYYEMIASASALKVLIYNIPAFSGVSMGADELGAMLDDDRFLGVKHTSNDYFALETLKSHHPDKVLYNGYDEMFLQGMAAGADGGIGSTYNFMAEKFVRLQALFAERRIEEAQALQHEVNEIIRILCRVGVMAGEKEVLNQLGMDFGVCRKPFRALNEEEKALIAREILPKLVKE